MCAWRGGRPGTAWRRRKEKKREKKERRKWNRWWSNSLGHVHENQENGYLHTPKHSVHSSPRHVGLVRCYRLFGALQDGTGFLLNIWSITRASHQIILLSRIKAAFTNKSPLLHFAWWYNDVALCVVREGQNALPCLFTWRPARFTLSVHAKASMFYSVYVKASTFYPICSRKRQHVLLYLFT